MLVPTTSLHATSFTNLIFFLGGEDFSRSFLWKAHRRSYINLNCHSTWNYQKITMTDCIVSSLHVICAKSFYFARFSFPLKFCFKNNINKHKRSSLQSFPVISFLLKSRNLGSHNENEKVPSDTIWEGGKKIEFKVSWYLKFNLALFNTQKKVEEKKNYSFFETYEKYFLNYCPTWTERIIYHYHIY